MEQKTIDPNLNKRVTSRSPMHIMLLADDSSSMQGESSRLATEAVTAWINELYMATRGTKPYFRFSLIVFGSDAEVLAEARDVRDIDPSAFVMDGSRGTTNLTEALRRAKALLTRENAGAEHCPPFVFLFTDGEPTNREGKKTAEVRHEAVVAAAELKALPLACGAPYVVTFALGKANDGLLKAVASEGLDKRLRNAGELKQFLPDIGTPTVFVDEDDEDDDGTLGRFRQRIKEL